MNGWEDSKVIGEVFELTAGKVSTSRLTLQPGIDEEMLHEIWVKHGIEVDKITPAVVEVQLIILEIKWRVLISTEVVDVVELTLHSIKIDVDSSISVVCVATFWAVVRGLKTGSTPTED
jgi:hypothetical protein